MGTFIQTGDDRVKNKYGVKIRPKNKMLENAIPGAV
jgi:hypothetical protein